MQCEAKKPLKRAGALLMTMLLPLCFFEERSGRVQIANWKENADMYAFHETTFPLFPYHSTPFFGRSGNRGYKS